MHSFRHILLQPIYLMNGKSDYTFSAASLLLDRLILKLCSFVRDTLWFYLARSFFYIFNAVVLCWSFGDLLKLWGTIGAMGIYWGPMGSKSA